MLSDWIYISVFNDAALIQQAIWFSNNILAKKKFKVIANACYTVGRRYKCILFIHFTLIESMLTSICIYMLECCWGEALWLAHTYLKVYIVCTFPEFPLSLSLRSSFLLQAPLWGPCNFWQSHPKSSNTWFQLPF